MNAKILDSQELRDRAYALEVAYGIQASPQCVEVRVGRSGGVGMTAMRVAHRVGEVVMAFGAGWIAAWLVCM